MEYKGFINDLNFKSLVGKTLTIPAGTLIKKITFNIHSNFILDINNNLWKMEGIIQQRDLEDRHKHSGSLFTSDRYQDVYVKNETMATAQHIVNGAIAHKIVYQATFGEIAETLAEPINGEFYVIQNPYVWVTFKNKKGDYLVDINEIEEIKEGLYRITETQQERDHRRKYKLAGLPDHSLRSKIK